MASGGMGWWEGSVPTHAFLTQGCLGVERVWLQPQ